MKTEIYHDFKMAEEFVHYQLENKGNHTWSLTRVPDETFEEDGEEYTHPVYVVRWTP
jgi:hypothetical protein